MNKQHTREQINAFFKQLLNACKKKNVYSVIETAEQMDVQYSQVQKRATSDKSWGGILEMCRMSCANNAEINGLKFKLPTEEAFKYMCENDDEFKVEYEKQKEQKQWEELQKSGQEAPIQRNYVMDVNETKNITTATPTTTQQEITKTEQWWLTRETAEKERIDRWKEKHAKENLGFSLETFSDDNQDLNDEKNQKTIKVRAKFNNSELTDNQKGDLLRSSICSATGSASEKYGTMILNQTVTAFFDNKEVKDVINNDNIIREALLSLAPSDPIEGMLCSRLIALHNQAMNFMSRTTNSEQTTAGVDMNINRSTKLFRLYNETLESLTKYRRKGSQTVTVQHVNVNSGGQAIVNGELNQGGGAYDKN